MKTNGETRRRIPFSVRADGAKEVILTGEFSEWATDRFRLKSKPDGTWTTRLTLPPHVSIGHRAVSTTANDVLTQFSLSAPVRRA